MELIDINGLYIWDNTIFDNMVIPSDIDRQTLIDKIIWDCRELTITVVSPAMIKRAIELWSRSNIYYWSELQKTLHYDYNPIENYDRHELTTDNYLNDGNGTERGTRTQTQRGSNTSTQTGTKTTTQTGKETTNQKGTETTTDALTVSAFDSSSLEPRETHTITKDYGADGITTTRELGVGGMVTTEDLGAGMVTTNTPDLTTTETPDIRTTDHNTGNNRHESYVHGNIGVMSSQQMVMAQRDVVNISLYNIIVNSFKNEFCILKY